MHHRLVRVSRDPSDGNQALAARNVRGYSKLTALQRRL
jgi:hypothetical protein